MVRFIKTQKPKKGIWNLERVACISKYFAIYVIKFKMKDTPENDIRFKIYMSDEEVIKLIGEYAWLREKKLYLLH